MRSLRRHCPAPSPWLSIAALALAGCSGDPTPSPSATPSGEGTPTPAASPTDGATPTPGVQTTPSPTATPTPSTPVPPTPTAPTGLTVLLLDNDSGLGVPGVVVWVGVDGTSEAVVSDTDGRVHFDAPLPEDGLSYAWVTTAVSSAGVSTEHRLIESHLGLPLRGELSFTLTSAEVSDLDTQLGGSVTPRAYEGSSTLYAVAGRGDVSWTTSLGEADGAVDFSVEANAPTWLLLTQAPYLDNFFGAPSNALPVAFDVILDPEGQALSSTLPRSFDDTVPITFTQLDAAMTQSYNDMRIVLPGERGSLFFTDEPRSLDDAEAKALPVPTLDGDLADASLTVRAIAQSTDGNLYQMHTFEQVQPGDAVTAELPALHTATSAVPLSAQSIEGARLSFAGDDGADLVAVQFVDRHRSTTSTDLVRRSWRVQVWAPTGVVDFPRIPSGAFDWEGAPALDAAAWYAQLAYTSTLVSYGSQDDTPGSTTTSRTLPSSAPDEYEPNDAAEAALLVSVDTSSFRSAILNHADGDEDWFRFDLAEARRMSATLYSSPSSTAEVSVVTAEGEVAWTAGTSLGYTVDRTLAAGTWYLRVRDPVNAHFDTYRLRVDPQDAAEDAQEPNDAPQEATEVPASTSLVGALEAEDVDWFAFTLEAPKVFAAELDTGANARAVTLALLDQDQAPLATATTDGGTFAGIVHALDAGSYLLQVSGADAERITTYTLAFSSTADPEGDETIETGQTLDAPGGAGLHVLAAEDVDVYRFTLAAPQLVYADVREMGLALTAAHHVAILTTGGAVLGTDDGADGRLLWPEVLSAGEHAVRVEADAGAELRVYALSLVVYPDTQEPNDDAVEATPLAAGDRATGYLADGLDEDWYTFTLEAAKTVYLDVFTLQYESGLSLSLLDESGQILATSEEEDGYSGASRELEPGTYRARLVAPATDLPIGYEFTTFAE